MRVNGFCETNPIPCLSRGLYGSYIYSEIRWDKESFIVIYITNIGLGQLDGENCY